MSRVKGEVLEAVVSVLAKQVKALTEEAEFTGSIPVATFSKVARDLVKATDIVQSALSHLESTNDAEDDDDAEIEED